MTWETVRTESKGTPVPNAIRTRLLAEIPPFRPVALQLMRLVGDTSQPLSRIVNLLRTDAVLTGEVLRLARSPLFGPRYEITNILQAVGYLGLDRINSLLVTVAMRALVDTGRSQFTHGCWRHNLATALLCQRLSQSAGLTSDRCYVGGLLHDIGRLALLRVFPDYGDQMAYAAANDEDLLAKEAGLFSLDHAEAGRWLLAQWGCPIELQNVAAWHEAPPSTLNCDRNLIVLVGVASQVADVMGMSAFPLGSSGDLTQIASQLGDAARRELLTGYPAIAGAVALKVNDIELNLL